MSLGGTTVGYRAFTFDPSNIRLRTSAGIVFLQGTYDPELAAGDWVWLNPAAALENVQAAHKLLGVTLRDELARRFPQVEGPRQQSADGGVAVVLRTKLSVSPSPDADARLDVDVVFQPCKFEFSLTLMYGESGHTGPSMRDAQRGDDEPFRSCLVPVFLPSLASVGGSGYYRETVSLW